MDHAIDVALGIENASSIDPAESPLTAREREVAQLIAQGLTNKAIAESLILSPRTIDGHLERIFSKLGLSSRAQLAAWVAGHPANPVG
jgi:DNA-binding CsgD family transcriptional regulator